MTSCVLWQKAKNNHGYGVIRRRGRNYLAHRAAYEAEHGPIPPGLQLDHLCRNPACVNVQHLEPVSPAVNTQRGAKAKLTRAQVDELRRRHAAGARCIDLAYEVGVAGGYMSRLLRGLTWRDP